MKGRAGKDAEKMKDIHFNTFKYLSHAGPMSVLGLKKGGERKAERFSQAWRLA